MIEFDNKTYELKYNLKRVEMIEATTGMPTMAELQRTRGMIGIASLKAYFAYGLKEVGEDTFIPPKKGMEICEQMIESEGYTAVCGTVMEVLERDCPFFFREN